MYTASSRVEDNDAKITLNSAHCVDCRSELTLFVNESIRGEGSRAVGEKAACLFMFAKGKFPCIVTFVIYSQVKTVTPCTP